MKDSLNTPAREYAPGQGDAVADRTINRKKPDGSIETWADVSRRVALGNASLSPIAACQGEFEAMHHHLRQASLLMSGRHLQHGDAGQKDRPQEVFTNCSTAASSFILFYLLLNGSGVGTAYDDDMMTVDWAKNLPHVVPVIRGNHPDVLSGEIGQQYVDVQFPQHEQVVVFEVPDSREGWAKATEKIEFMTWQGTHANTLLLLDFSGVRHRGQPIGGMQNRPASGPGPLMHAIAQIAALKGSGKDPWEATMHVDHYLSECVLVGGARRAARMATKTWRDKSVLRFVSVKKGGVLWSSNNSVTVDQEFWDAVKKVRFLKSQGRGVGEAVQEQVITDLERHAHDVFEAVCQASYFDGTGEPGLINVDKLVQINEGVEALFGGEYAESERFKLDPETKQMTAQKAKVFSTKGYTQITNPCGEISLALLGGYCVIADVVPFFAGTVAESTEAWDADAEDAFRTATRALIRVNTMDCLYKKEVLRTNRIGVGITGLHEYAWSRFGYGWKDIVNEAKSLDFWLMLSRFSNACVEEADRYAEALGMSRPHTVTTMKPAGCATPDTRVKTTEGVLSLEEIFALSGLTLAQLQAMPDGTWIDPTRAVQVLDENDEAKDITKLYVNGVKEVFEIAFEDGSTVRLTGNHKLKLVTGEWKRVDELLETDEVASF